jgi:hypothetical protein
MPPLRSYLIERLDRNQTGFVNGLGTSVNIQLLLRELRSTPRRLGRCCIFVDFKSAYNTIRRDLLYRLLVEKNILSELEVNFLRCLHESLYF